MRKILVSLMASLALASPALANEARVEGRAGIVWGGGEEDAVAGIAAGYDFDLGANAFAGAEISGDKILTDGTRVSLGLAGRVGFKAGDAGKLYGVGGWQSKPCRLCDDFWTAGAGYQHNLGQQLYGKIEYRHMFFDNARDANTVAVGVGTRF